MAAAIDWKNEVFAFESPVRVKYQRKKNIKTVKAERKEECKSMYLANTQK